MELTMYITQDLYWWVQFNQALIIDVLVINTHTHYTLRTG